MRVTKISALFLVAGLAALACSPSADSADEGMDAQASAAEDRAALEALVDDWDAAMAASDVDGLMATYTSDPVALPPGGEAARGAQAVRGLWNGFQAQGETETENDVQDIWVSGDLGGAWGTYTLTIASEDGETIEDSGKFMFIAQRQDDGSWKSAANIWNSDSEQMPMGN